MTTRALILADRKAGEFAPLAPGLLPALVPVAGKPVIQHCVEDLWEGGVREVRVAVPAGDDTIRAELGDGQRFGVVLRYVESGGPQQPAELQALAGPATDAPLLVARGDVLRGRSVRSLLARAAGVDGDLVLGTVGSRPAGLAWLRRHREDISAPEEWAFARRPDGAHGSRVELGDVGLAQLDGLPDLFDACLGVIEGRYAGLLTDGRARPGSTIHAAPRASMARSVHASGVARLGRGAVLHDAVELAGRVEIGDRCVIDEGAQLIDTVVLPGTYVGRGVRLQNAIVSGAWLYRVDLATCQRIDDPLLLAGPAAIAA